MLRDTQKGALVHQLGARLDRPPVNALVVCSQAVRAVSIVSVLCPRLHERRCRLWLGRPRALRHSNQSATSVVGGRPNGSIYAHEDADKARTRRAEQQEKDSCYPLDVPIDRSLSSPRISAATDGVHPVSHAWTFDNRRAAAEHRRGHRDVTSHCLHECDAHNTASQTMVATLRTNSEASRTGRAMQVETERHARLGWSTVLDAFRPRR